jgi:hypothetical protein
MKLLIAIVLAVMVIGLGESVRVGGSAERVIPLGSLTQNASFQGNISEETNATNQTNISSQDRGMIDIKSPMSPIPAINKRPDSILPNSIQANSIAYQFTT